MITSKTIQPTVNRRQEKYLIISLLSLIFILALPANAVKRIEANPINIAAMLTEEVDSKGIASTLEYYGYQPVEISSSLKTEDSRLKTEYRHPNGSIIRYTFTTAENGKEYSTIEVKSKVPIKDRDQILQNLNFKKVGTTYERRSIDHQTRCSSAHGFLRFVNQPKTKTASTDR